MGFSPDIVLNYRKYLISCNIIFPWSQLLSILNLACVRASGHSSVCHVWKQKLITQQPVDLEKISRCQNDHLGLLLQIRCAKVAPPPPMVLKIGTKKIIWHDFFRLTLNHSQWPKLLVQYFPPSLYMCGIHWDGVRLMIIGGST